jgi:hypothetical protein
MESRPIEVVSETNSRMEKGGVITNELIRKHETTVGYDSLTYSIS